jgi:hypothetical protein
VIYKGEISGTQYLISRFLFAELFFARPQGVKRFCFCLHRHHSLPDFQGDTFNLTLRFTLNL